MEGACSEGCIHWFEYFFYHRWDIPRRRNCDALHCTVSALMPKREGAGLWPWKENRGILAVAGQPTALSKSRGPIFQWSSPHLGWAPWLLCQHAFAWGTISSSKAHLPGASWQHPHSGAHQAETQPWGPWRVMGGALSATFLFFFFFKLFSSSSFL